MTKADFLQLLNELLELEPGTLTGDENLKDFEIWDSMTVLGFIAMVDEHFGFTVSPERLAQSQTVNDLVELLDGRVAAS
jgi:acyl carrier protein